ncbi:MAG: hypothetical protein QOD63_2143 [Actinomycetota bacterium]|jgi:hypothetical protein|nr:hypothetical protein [Actinomycetota bacterium]
MSLRSSASVATTRPKRTDVLLVLIGILAALALVTCGGSDKKASTTTTVSPLTTTQSIDTNFTGAGSAEFCDLAKTLNTNISSAAGGSTAQLKANLEKADAAIHKAVDAAPAEIKPDVKVIADSFTSAVTAIAGVNYDLTKVPPAALATFQTPEFSNSAARLQAYMTDVCKVRK